MQKFEEKEAVKWAAAFTKRQKEQRVTDAKDALYAGLMSDMGGEAVMDIINNKASDFGGTGPARKAVFQMLTDMYKNERITESQVRSVLAHKFVHRGMGETTVGKAFQRDLVGLETTILDVRQARSTRAQKDLANRRFEFQENLRQLFAERAESGVPLTNEEKNDINTSYQSLGLGLNVPELQSYETAEDREEDEAREFLEARKAVRGFYIESDLNGMPTSVRAAFIDQVKKDTQITASLEPFKTGRDSRIGGAVDDHFNYIEGKRKPSGGFEKHAQVKDRALRDADQIARDLMLTGKFDASEVNELTISKVSENIKNGVYEQTVKVSPNTERQQQLIDLRTSLIDPNSPPAAGIVDEIAQAVAYFQTQAGNLPEGQAPVRTLPEVFNIAASGTSSTGIDVALSELAKRGIVGFKKPAVEQKVDELSPAHRALLRKPTAGRLNRVMLEQGDDVAWMLDTIASVESKSFGGYDAFNRGGTNNGYTAIGAGNSQTDLDKPISSMTLGEIMARHDRGELHAVGRYQFIAKTFKEVFPLTGLSEDTVFSPEIQDLFAITRAKQRVSWRGGTQGLINEWRGLKYVSQEERERMLAVIKGLGPYNDPSNTLPGLKYN